MMNKKVQSILNSMIGAFSGVFAGRSIYTIWDYHQNSWKYELQSAPWYTSILVNAAVTAVVVLTALLLKLWLKRRAK